MEQVASHFRFYVTSTSFKGNLKYSICYLCVAVVGVPAGSQTLLPSNIPNHEVRVPNNDLLYIAADGGGRVDGFFR